MKTENEIRQMIKKLEDLETQMVPHSAEIEQAGEGIEWLKWILGKPNTITCFDETTWIGKWDNDKWRMKDE